jgi:hypothetical protein
MIMTTRGCRVGAELIFTDGHPSLTGNFSGWEAWSEGLAISDLVRIWSDLVGSRGAAAGCRLGKTYRKYPRPGSPKPPPEDPGCRVPVCAGPSVALSPPRNPSLLHFVITGSQ